jgi:hypothetical protein
MSTTAATSQSTLAASIPRAVFSFGTQKYTAIQTDGPSEAVIAKNTITAGGQALQLNGGYASLATNGLVLKTGSIKTTTSANSAAPSVVTGGVAIITLASSTLTAVALSDGSLSATKTIGASDFQWVVGQQTLTPFSNGIVVASGTKKETYTYKLTNITMSPSKTSLKSLSTIPFPSGFGADSSTTSGDVASGVGDGATTSSSAVKETVTETATVTVSPSNVAAYSRGTKLVWMMGMSLLVAILAGGS